MVGLGVGAGVDGGVGNGVKSGLKKTSHESELVGRVCDQ